MLEDCTPGQPSGHVAVNRGHYILVFSGRFPKGQGLMPLHVIWAYNLYTEEWTKHVIPQGQTVPTNRSYACAVVIGSDVYMFGGYMFPERNETNTLWKLASDPQESFVWSEIVAINKEKTPSPRSEHTGWEHGGKLWTFGGSGSSLAGYLYEYGDFVHNCNNQLLCFNPSNEEWTNPQCYGFVPEPRDGHATTKSQDKIWLYGGCNSMTELQDLFELDMHSFTWTLIQIKQMQPFPQSSCTLSMISDDVLILHGGYTASWKRSSDTWILDLKTITWKQYNSVAAISRVVHTSSRGINNSVVIIGGLLSTKSMDQSQSIHKTTFQILTEPKSLQQLAMQKIYKHHTVLPWKCLPRKLTVLLDIQETEDADEASDLPPE